MKKELPAQDIDSEESLIASLILDNHLFDDCGGLYPGDFYRSFNGFIFKTISLMISKNNRVDLSTLWFELKKEKEYKTIPSGASYLARILETASIFNTKQYVSIIKECSLTRQIKFKCMNIIDSNKGGEDLLSMAQSDFLNIQSTDNKDQIKRVKDIILDHIDRIETANTTEQSIYYKLGFPRIDNCLKTIGPKLIIIAGRPGSGKTAIAVTMSRNLDKIGVKVGFLSIEMPEEEIIDRWISIESEIDSSRLGKFKGLSDNEIQPLNDAGAVLYDSFIKIDSTGSLDILDVERKCRKLKKGGVQVIFIDQLSQIGNKYIKSGELTALYAENCTRIARLKKELCVPIFLLCQLNRDMKGRSKKEPILTDLKQSGKIEEDADAVLLIHRPEEYAGKNEIESLRGKTILNLVKNRSGPKFRENKIMFNHQTTYFYQEEQWTK